MSSCALLGWWCSISSGWLCCAVLAGSNSRTAAASQATVAHSHLSATVHWWLAVIQLLRGALKQATGSGSTLLGLPVVHTTRAQEARNHSWWWQADLDLDSG